MDPKERLALGVLLAAAAIILGVRTLPGESFLEAADRWPYDLAQKFLLPEPPNPDEVTVIVIDDESLVRLSERWPMSRGTWARFFRKAHTYGAKVVGVDAWFETPAPKAEVELARDVVDKIEDSGFEEEAEGEALVDFLEELAVERDGDRQMSEAIAKAGVIILGAACQDLDRNALVKGRPEYMRVLDHVPDDVGWALTCPALATSLPVFTMSSAGQAGLTVPIDGDGLARRYAYISRAFNDPLPSLALASARLAHPEQAEELVARAAAFDRGTPRLLYRHSAEFRHVRFSDVLEAPDDSKPLKEGLGGRIVLIGVSAQGTQDYISTPVDHDTPGVHVHANAVVDLLADRVLRMEGYPAVGGAIGGFLLLLALALVLWKTDKGGLIIGGTAGATLLWYVAYVAALRAGWVIPFVPVVAMFIGWATVRLVFQFLRAAGDRQRAKAIREAFTHYLAPAVVEALIEDPDKLKLGGERREITAFFSDVAGFTSISEAMDPADLVQLLNECLGAMTEIVIEEGGIVDKYIGDAIVAMFGAPMEQPDHAVRACRAALRCQRILEELRPKWESEGKPDVRVRIGVNTGTALVGNMGSEARFDYTMLGDTVNLAARLEGANKQYGTYIMAGQETVKRIPFGIFFRELDAIRVKGKKVGIQVYEVVEESELVPVHLQTVAERYKLATQAWREQRWQDARELFGALAAEGDPPSEVFLGRVDAYEADPPGDDWDGVFTMTTK